MLSHKTNIFLGIMCGADSFLFCLSDQKNGSNKIIMTIVKWLLYFRCHYSWPLVLEQSEMQKVSAAGSYSS